MKKEFSKLSNFIKIKGEGKNIYYLANSGNYGDGLIRNGTLKFFHDYGIKYKEITNKYFYIKYLFTKKNSLFIYGGGGGWCKLWNHSKNYVKRINKKNIVIVLPSSYEKDYSNLNNVYFFSRDKFNSIKKMPNSIFCHDMAFYLGKIPIKTEIKFEKGYFYRTDKESNNNILIPKNNIDLSLNGNHLSPINNFIIEIGKYKEIYTDRLHIAICGILLGKKVFLYSSNYFKIHDIYLSSIKPFYKNVTFKTEK